MRQATEHQLKSHLTFDPGQRCPKAKVRRPPEGKMPVVSTGDV